MNQQERQQQIDEILDNCIKDLEDTAEIYIDSALEKDACQNNLKAAKKLKELNENELLQQVQANYEHCEKWEGKFREYAKGLGGKARNEGPMNAHGEAKETFQETHEALQKLLTIAID